MIFSSLSFIYIFLPATLLLFLLSRRLFGLQAALACLSICSVLFYGVWKPIYLPLFAGSVLWNFLFARVVDRETWRGKACLALGVTGNLGLLFYFKYAGFVTEVLNDLNMTDAAMARLALPLGISFFTFQQITYLIDRSSNVAPLTSFPQYLLFVSFFPQLIAGPIVHHGEMMPQFRAPRILLDNFYRGMVIFSIGLAKKVLIADQVAPMVEAGFADPGALPLLNAWATVIGYTIQLYFDFSGYSDMAVGLGLLFGIKIPWNFLSPYKATNISDFWRTWHVTLSRFLRDYIYIPLGGSRQGKWQTGLNLMVTMVLGGIWHGAGWTFILWGFLHGFALTGYHLSSGWRPKIPKPAAWILTQSIVIGGWVLFRATSMENANAMFSAMFQLSGPTLTLDKLTLNANPWLLLGIIIAVAAPNTSQIAEKISRRWTLWAMLIFALSCYVLMGQIEPPEFLYFDF